MNIGLVAFTIPSLLAPWSALGPGRSGRRRILGVTCGHDGNRNRLGARRGRLGPWRLDRREGRIEVHRVLITGAAGSVGSILRDGFKSPLGCREPSGLLPTRRWSPRTGLTLMLTVEPTAQQDTGVILDGRATSVPFTAVLNGPERTTTDNAEAASTCAVRHRCR
jgi:hypothetical protein